MKKIICRAVLHALLPVMRWSLTWPVDQKRKEGMAELIRNAERAIVHGQR